MTFLTTLFNKAFNIRCGYNVLFCLHTNHLRFNSVHFVDCNLVIIASLHTSGVMNRNNKSVNKRMCISYPVQSSLFEWIRKKVIFCFQEMPLMMQYWIFRENKYEKSDFETSCVRAR